MFPSEERRKIIQINLTKQAGRESKVKRKGSKIKRKYGCRPVSESVNNGRLSRPSGKNELYFVTGRLANSVVEP